MSMTKRTKLQSPEFDLHRGSNLKYLDVIKECTSLLQSQTIAYNLKIVQCLKENSLQDKCDVEFINMETYITVKSSFRYSISFGFLIQLKNTGTLKYVPKFCSWILVSSTTKQFY
ncbi:hypothetical protein PHYBLDRAFT_163769 [Phycomyces blakesleeanus NRRL 1555(-)]|uniref:Uncharacterized protein n=1 Tax=Phycomyces blakesleeanus (strain ATCC 8743b / DSM 1359 / FGSC 10004 / NBRC 33097 / NRRL 1555) TaxID=763407 RepID=A0A167PWS9_PHYB8|nr:hypothetical protein PHYBLDRAFT_163769 [Phycomyces blakesleeanus NRRL 1555(-)]OAD78676.1 hypothetical protein PHYBLDRAFT_163769 [Phycomyces blakesleeanus NRRL 1555(-)]|eukprot:XP_018296716.1 hypothetical protein PHYBLDRAFT_163769 [Phycomyces blakesleeanus NRRL 1555(-)]